MRALGASAMAWVHEPVTAILAGQPAPPRSPEPMAELHGSEDGASTLWDCPALTDREGYAKLSLKK